MLQNEAKEVEHMRKELVTARLALGLTQAEVALEVGISRSFYGLIEVGSRNPNYGLAKKISQYLMVQPEGIFFDLDGFIMKQNNEALCPYQPPNKLPQTG